MIQLLLQANLNEYGKEFIMGSKLAHLLVSLEVKFHTVGAMLILKKQGIAHSFFQKEKKSTKITKKILNQKNKLTKTTNTLLHQPSPSLKQTNPPSKDPPNSKPEEISCKLILNKNAGSYERRSYHLVFIFLCWLILHEISSDISQ